MQRYAAAPPSSSPSPSRFPRWPSTPATLGRRRLNLGDIAAPVTQLESQVSPAPSVTSSLQATVGAQGQQRLAPRLVSGIPVRRTNGGWGEAEGDRLEREVRGRGEATQLSGTWEFVASGSGNRSASANGSASGSGSGSGSDISEGVVGGISQLTDVSSSSEEPSLGGSEGSASMSSQSHSTSSASSFVPPPGEVEAPHLRVRATPNHLMRSAHREVDDSAITGASCSLLLGTWMEAIEKWGVALGVWVNGITSRSLEEPTADRRRREMAVWRDALGAECVTEPRRLRAAKRLLLAAREGLSSTCEGEREGLDMVAALVELKGQLDRENRVLLAQNTTLQRRVGDDGGHGAMCIVCFDTAPGVVFLPCRHMACCAQCVARMSPGMPCPICRAEISCSFQVFHP